MRERRTDSPTREPAARTGASAKTEEAFGRGHVRLREVFLAALEIAAEARGEYLDRECGNDGALRGAVESLLRSHDRAGAFLEEPIAAGLAGEEESDELDRLVGDRVGPWRLVAPIGRGGMGVVYLAERDDGAFAQRVAVKLLRQGLGSKALLRRFHRERATLARLEHPHVARLLDAGTTATGLPYLVMELITGLPIDLWCDERNLPVAARLELFLQVCAAVEHAHRHLVVHRDIKPSNVLVDDHGMVKLLDFGIAKLLPGDQPEGTRLTRAQQLVLTPEYASPEQVRGEPVSTATDVYALGVLLYELLTGLPPYVLAGGGLSELERVVCGVQPERPSTVVLRGTPAAGAGGDAAALATCRGTTPPRLRRQLTGDLDNIVSMALRKEPERRYASVERLAEDVRRHLGGHPVLARSESVTYRAGKFLRRHRAAVAGAALVTLSLLGGLATTLWQARVAERRFAEVQALAGSFIFELHDTIADLPGSTPARELLVERSLEYLDRLARDARGEPELLRDLAVAYRRVGDVQGYPNNANLGDTAAAVASYNRAMALSEELLERRPRDAAARRDLAIVHERLADVSAWTGDLAAARRHADQALGHFGAIAEATGEPAARLSLAISLVKMGDLLGNPSFPNHGDLAGALASYRRSLAILETLAGVPEVAATVQRYLGLVHERHGTIEHAMGDLRAALASYRRSFAIREDNAALRSGSAAARRDLAIAHEKIGDVLLALGEAEQALASYQLAFPVFRELAANDPRNVNARRALAISHEKLAAALLASGEAAAGRRELEASFALREELAAADPENQQVRDELDAARERLAALDEASR